MERHEILCAEEEIDFPRAELVLSRLEVDAVKNQVEKSAVGLDFRVMNLCEGVLDGELVEMKHVRQ